MRKIRRTESGTGYWRGVVVGEEDPGGLAEVGGYVSWATSLSMQHELGHNLGPRRPPDARDRRGRWCDAVTDADAG